MIFINKLWNACRFVHVSSDIKKFSLDTTEKKLIQHYDTLMLHERWILSKLMSLTHTVSESMEGYSFSEAGVELYRFTKNSFCDYYIEEFKLTKDTSKYGQDVILYAIHILLRLWHPYIPFVTEELYQKLGFT